MAPEGWLSGNQAGEGAHLSGLIQEILRGEIILKGESFPFCFFICLCFECDLQGACFRSSKGWFEGEMEPEAAA